MVRICAKLIQIVTKDEYLLTHFLPSPFLHFRLFHLGSATFRYVINLSILSSYFEQNVLTTIILFPFLFQTATHVHKSRKGCSTTWRTLTCSVENFINLYRCDQIYSLRAQSR